MRACVTRKVSPIAKRAVPIPPLHPPPPTDGATTARNEHSRTRFSRAALSARSVAADATACDVPGSRRGKAELKSCHCCAGCSGKIAAPQSFSVCIDNRDSIQKNERRTSLHRLCGGLVQLTLIAHGKRTRFSPISCGANGVCVCVQVLVFPSGDFGECVSEIKYIHTCTLYCDNASRRTNFRQSASAASSSKLQSKLCFLVARARSTERIKYKLDGILICSRITQQFN